ncbi:MAG: phage gp6-like head-tail connector protein [Hamadaea sp.]|nr:phage gp6-like head-tail connector protein [Hamadaea sp.]
MDVEDAVDDYAIGLAITAASRAVDRHCGRQFGKTDTPVARVFQGFWDYGSGGYAVDTLDFMTTVGLVVEGSAVIPSSAYTLTPRNAEADGRPYDRILLASGGRVGDVTVTATWGWTVVPKAVEQATAIQALRFLKRKDSPFGVAGSPDAGSELRLLAKVDPDVAVALGPYKRMGVVA